MPSLKAFNTFGLDVQAKDLHIITSVQDLKSFDFKSVDDYFILGGGSNILLTQDIQISVLKNEIVGKNILEETDDHVLLEVGGGENWHNLVLWTLINNYGGFENLSLIPGTVGASPIQNIGAYGVEIMDLIVTVHAYDLLDKKEVSFEKDQCHFSYRDSIFKQAENKGRFFITSVVYQLHKDIFKVNTTYGPIKNVLSHKNIERASIKDVSKAVIEIRQSKLPDPAVIGNCGSFFKNPIVSRETMEEIDTRYDVVPFYPAENEMVKIPAGWLIEQCGWKGKKVGNTGNYEHQALIIVNHGGASGHEIYEHAKNIHQSVMKEFGIELEFEVNVV